MPARVSPARTVWDAAEALPPPPPGIVSREPAMTRLGFAMPLASTSARTVVPLRWAMSLRVSPLRTTWAPEAATAKAPTRISAQMSRGRRGTRTCNCLLRSPPARKWPQRTEAPPATQPPISTGASGVAASLRSALGVEALEGGLGGVVDEAHALGDRLVPGL